MKVFFSEKAQTSLHTYIARYLDRFLELYSDTGLGDAEVIIRENYIQNARLLNQPIHGLVINHLWNDHVIGYELQLDGNIYHTTVSLGSRRIYVTYTEDKETEERIVKDIEIWRK